MGASEYLGLDRRAAAEAKRSRQALRRPSKAEDESHRRAMEEAGITREDFLRGVEADEEERPF
jgi:enoyl-CoA hydratase/carnithine racemase